MSNDKDIIKKLVYYVNRLVDGDEVLNQLTTDMIKWGFWDEDGFYIEDEGEGTV